MNAEELLIRLKKRTRFQSCHEVTLQELSKTMCPIAQEVALAFYDYLGLDEETHRLIWAVPGRVERLYTTFANWYQELFSGCYDAAYAKRRFRIGLVHARFGIGPRYLIPAMGIVQELSLEHLSEVLKLHQTLEAVKAFEKIITIEIALIEESYLAALEHGLSLGHNNIPSALKRGATALLQDFQT